MERMFPETLQTSEVVGVVVMLLQLGLTRETSVGIVSFSIPATGRTIFGMIDNMNEALAPFMLELEEIAAVRKLPGVFIVMVTPLARDSMRLF